ncbi:MAG: hypothetical protein ABIO16_08455, partial [Nocardioides sp.]
SHTEVKAWDPGSLSYVEYDVSLTYTGSECRDGVDVDVGVTYAVHLRLSHPVGGRQVLDGTCSIDEWSDREACQVHRTEVRVE